MKSTTIRVSERTRDRIAEMAKASNRPMTAVVERALDALERREFFARFNARYDELRNDAAVWHEIVAEREEDSPSLRDGLE